MNSPFSFRDMALPLFMLCASIAGILTVTADPPNYAAVLLGAIGAVASIAFLLGKKSIFFLLAPVWIYGQFPSIAKVVTSQGPDGSVQTIEQPIIDAGQGFKYSVGLDLGNPRSTLQLHVNLVPIGWLTLYHLLLANALIGCSVSIRQFRKDSPVSRIFPLAGTVQRTVQLGNEKHWLLVELEQMIGHGGGSAKHVLTRDKEGELFKPGKTARVSYIVLVPDPVILHDGANKKDQFEFLDWGLVSLKR
jgi:hypothetical protein